MPSRLVTYLASRCRWAWPSLGLVIAASEIGFGLIRSDLMAYDFTAYLDASRRLIAGAPVYLGSLLDGSALTTSAGQYLYPPPLAQLLVPLALLPRSAAFVSFLVYTAISFVVFAGTLALLWRVAGGAVRPRGALIVLTLISTSYPVISSVATGNVGLFLAGCFALAVLGRPIAGATIGGAIKLLPASLLLLVRRPMRLDRVSIVSILLLAVSIALSPSTWSTYTREALPASMRTVDPIGLGGNPAAVARLSRTVAEIRSPGGDRVISALRADRRLSSAQIDSAVKTSLLAQAPVELLRAIGRLEDVFRIAGLVIAGLLVSFGVMLARNPTRRHVAVAYLAAGPLLVPWSLWAHYLVILIPLAIVAWRVGDAAARRRIAIGFMLSSIPSAAIFGPYLWIPLALLFLLDGIRRTRLPSVSVQTQ